MAPAWEKPCPAYFYLAFFLGGLGAGVFSVWWNDLWESIPFWTIVIKLSMFQTLLMFIAINAYRFFLRYMQVEDVCEKSSTV